MFKTRFLIISEFYSSLIFLLQVKYQASLNKVDRDMILRAEAFIAGYRYANDLPKLEYKENSSPATNTQETYQLTKVEKMLVEMCKLCDE